MDYKYQDKILINDIVDRNYYHYFIEGQKSLCLTFYYNYKFNNSNLIPNFSLPESNPEQIILNLNALLDFYIEKDFKCDIKIKDDLWITDLENRDKIINVFIQKFQNSYIRPCIIEMSFNAIHCLEEKKNWFIDVINKFNNIGIQIKLSFETMLIDIVDIEYLLQIKDFLLNYTSALKVRINPNNFVYFSEIFDILYENFYPILYLYEEDNINWTEYKINEYIEFLDRYIDKLYQDSGNNDIQFLREIFLKDKINLISLKDNGVLNDTNSRGSCPFYQSLNILLEDLTINLCPKFQYDDQVIGQYEYDNGKIISIEPKYLGLIAMNVHLKKSSTPHCENCPYVVFCKGFCCKESYNYCLNPIIPLRETCEMKKVKYAFLFYKLHNLNIISLEKLNNIPGLKSEYIEYIFNLYTNIIGGISNGNDNA